ncbi:hypothetical protein DIPPA_21396 [Diplonema papillatum]|nr:hypothetical protein DIPPA_21396 [Diplonema papillatum]
MRYENVRCRRPRQCCKRGHHGAPPAAKRGPVGQRASAYASKVPEPKPRPQGPQPTDRTPPPNGERAKGTDGACSQRKRGRDDEQAGGSARKKPKPQQPPLNEKRTPKVDSPQTQPKRSGEDEQAKAGSIEESRSRPRKQLARKKRKCAASSGDSSSSNCTSDVKSAPETNSTRQEATEA